MCGLFFVVRRDAPVDVARFETAFTTMRHRGPDATSHRYGEADLAESGGCGRIHWAAGHHRLSILDLDARSNQPFERDGALLLYNGEAYDYAALRGQALFQNAAFATSGDTEVMFEGLRRAGPDFLEAVNGMWGLVFADWAAGVAHASRDRFGKKPLFWRMDGDTLCVASTIGVIDRYLGRVTRFDEQALAAYVAHGAAYPGGGTATCHADIRQVPPATTLSFDLARWTVTERRHFAFERPPPDNPDAELPYILADAFRLRLTSDRPVGLLLSGGVDSSLLLSVAHATGLHDRLRCFIGDTGKSEDAIYARECVDALGIKAETVKLGYDSVSFDRFLRICRHQEKPFPLIGNAMAMAEMYEGVATFGIPVVLDGTGGDEMFGGYWDRTYPFAAREAWRARDLGWIARTALGDGRRRVKDTVRALRRPRPAKADGVAARFARFDPRNVPTGDPLIGADLGFDDALTIDASRGRLGEWLWQNDRNAMMSSIENRSPLLDWRLTAFLRTGYATKFNGRWNKRQLRKAFDAFSALPTQWRVQKQGFRWNRRSFVLENRSAILDLLAGSPTVDALVDRTRLVEAASSDERTLRSNLVARLLSIAGVAEAMNA